MTTNGSSFRDGSNYMKLFSVALVVAAVIALIIGIFAESFIEWAGLVKECADGEECPVELSKLGAKLVVPIRLTFLIFAALWALEIPHVRLSRDTRHMLAEAEEAGKPFSVDGLKKGNLYLSFYQFALVVGVVGGFAAMMFVPSMLKGAGVKAPAVAAVTLLTWVAYVGPLVFCAFRFHHISLTLDTRRTLATLAGRLEEAERTSDGIVEDNQSPAEAPAS